MAEPAIELTGPLTDQLEFQTVRVSGSFLQDQTIVPNRSFLGTSGYHVVTPLDAGAFVVPINRGFAPLTLEPTEVAVPAGRVNITGLVRQAGPQLAVQLISQQPQQDEIPATLDLPTLDVGPHRGYAVQWFLFALVGVVGYPLVLRRTARDGDRHPIDDLIDDVT